MGIFDEARSRIASRASNTVNASRNNQSTFDQARSRIATGQAERTAARQREKRTMLLDKAAGGNKKGPGYSQVELPGVRDNAARKADRQENRIRSSIDTSSYDDRLAELNAQLENTPVSYDLNDPARYNLKQEILQLEQQKDAFQKSETERLKAADWERRQAASIGKTGDAELMADLQKLRELEAVNNRWSDNQKEYNALLKKLRGKYGEDLDAWRSYVSRLENKEEATQMQENVSEKAKEKPFWMSAATFPTNTVSGLGFIDVAGQKAQRFLTGSDVPIDYNTPSMRPAQITNAIRGSVSEKIEEDTAGKIGSDTAFGNLYSGLYNLGMSMGDSAIGALTGSSIMMAGSAATNAMLEAKERGATDTQALLFGLSAGAMEGAMEKLSIDSLLAMDDPKTAGQLFKSILKQGGVEASEEFNTNLANTLADAIIMGDKSQLNQMKNYFIQNGYSPEEAEKLALKEWGKGLATDAIAGFISGGLFETAKGVPGYIGNRTSDNQQNTNAPQQTQTNAPNEDMVAKMAQDLTRAKPSVQEQAAVETPNIQTEVIAPEMKPGVNVEAALNNVLAEENEAVGDMEAKPTEVKPAMGAADYGFAPYSNYQNTQSDFLPEGANPARPVDMPATDPTGRPTRRGAKTLYGAEITSDARAEQMELEFMRGVYGYDVKTNQAAVDNARATIEREGYDKSYGRVTERLRDLKDLKQTMTEAILLYNNAVQTGNDTDAAELALLISMSGTEGGQLVQTFSMFRQLTPEGQLAGIQRVTDKINEKVYGKGKRKDGNPIPEHQWQDVENTVDDIRETALRLLENIHQAFSGDNHGVPVENWLAEIGDKLAKTVDSNKTGRNRTPNPTIAKTIQKDLERFAKGYMDKVKPGNQYSNAKALENFLNNPDQYSEAWDTARQTLREKYKDNPEMLDALNDFLASGIDMEQMGRGIDNDIKKALSDIGVKTSELIRKSDADKTEIASKIADMLMKDHQLSEVDANTMASFILERFNQIVAERSEAALKQRFGKKDKKQKKTFNQDFTELANMGAFTNANWRDAVTEKLFGHEITIDPKLVEQFRNAPDQQTRDTIMEQIYENVGRQIPTTFGEAANQWRYTSMLLAPSTHLKNMGGNLSMMAMKLGKDALGAGIETVANAATKGKTGHTKSILNVFSKNDQRLMQQAWADFENVKEDVKGIGKHKDNAMGKVGEHRDYWKLNNPETKVAKALDATLRAAEKVPKFNSDLMDREDQWFSQPDYALSLAGYMKANKLTEITPEARTYAIKEAQKATFRDANAVSEFAKRAGNTNSKLWNGIVNTIFPFKGTPANVGVRAVEYSPVGFATTIGKAIKASKEGTFKATDFIDDLSANFVGSGLAVAGYFLAQAGLLRATGVGDEKEKEAQREAGYKDNSFTLFGHSIPETVFTSASAPMFIGAALYEALATKALDGEAYTIDDVLQAFSTTVDPIMGQTMLDGLSDVLYSVRSTQGGIGEYAGSIGINIVGNYLASYIPTLLSRVSAAADGVSRETYTDKNKPLPKVQKEVQDLMMKTPLRTKLPEKVDNYGRTQENWMSDADTKVGKALGSALNVVTPTFPSKIQETDLDAALQELYRSGADTSGKKVFQTDAPTQITVDGEKVKLTAEQHEKLEKIRGENTVYYQSNLQDNDTFEKLPKEMQIYATDKMYDYVEQKSKMAMGVGYKPDTWVYDLQNASPEKVSEVIVQKAVESMAEDKRLYENKYAGIADMLDTRKINDTVALAVMSDTAVDGYMEYCKKENVSVADYAEVYAYMNKVKDLSKTLDYIDKMDLFKREKIALAQGIHYANPNIIRTDNPVSQEWLLKHGATDEIVEQFSESRKKLYDSYILDKVEMGDYLTIYNFKNTERKNADGEMKKPKQDEVIAEIDKLDISKAEKRNLFLSMDYSAKKIPYWWK